MGRIPVGEHLGREAMDRERFVSRAVIILCLVLWLAGIGLMAWNSL